jgi:putative CocE/NonD family hydrolase
MRSFLVALLSVSVVLAGCASNDDDDGSPTGGQQAVPPGQGLGGDATAIVTSVPPGTYNFTGPYSRLLTQGNLSVLPPAVMNLPSDVDGANIEIAYWLPDGPGPFPVFLFSSPYFVARDNACYDRPGVTTGVCGQRTVDNPGGAVQQMIDEFVPHGYAFATHAVRGTAGSTGCNDLMGALEIADIDQAVTWLGEQEWSSGAVAMTGVSYDGSTPWSAASTGNPYLKTIIPVSGVPDMYGLMYRNGSSEARGPLVLNALYYQIGITSGPAAAQDYAERILCPDAWTGVAMSGLAGILGEDPTGYWQARNRKPAVEQNYQGSVFSIQGLQDWNVDPSQVIPWVDQLEAQGIRTKQLLGQWGHAWPDGIGADGQNIDPDGDGNASVRADYKEWLFRWLEQELKGIPQDTGPAVQVRDNLGRWRNEAHFPPHDTNWTTYHLSGTALTLEPGDEQDIFIYPSATEEQCVPNLQDPSGDPMVCPTDGVPSSVDVDVRRFVDFTLPTMDRELLVSGLPKVHITVTPHGPGGYIGAYLYSDDDLSDDDRGVRLGWTSMNLRYADGSTQSSDVIPGEPIQAMMEIQPMDAVVPANHTLVLRIWALATPDRVPTIPPSTVQLNLGPSVESVLKLPTIVRDPNVYFQPPVPPVEQA